MAEFRFVTSGMMTIKLNGLSFGRHIQDPKTNVKSFIAHPSEIFLQARDMRDFTDWGRIELVDLRPGTGYLELTIDSDTLGWFGTAQIALYVNGQNIINDNVQSGVKGPLGDPKRVKRYAIDYIG